MTNAENTAPNQQKRVVGVPFKPGQSGNPAGRPKGARSRLGEAFVDALLADWQQNGVQAIIDMRDEKPADYVKIVASILPKEISGPDGDPIEVRTLPLGSLSEATLRELAAVKTGDE